MRSNRRGLTRALLAQITEEVRAVLEEKRRGAYKTDAEKQETKRKAANRLSPAERREALFPGTDDMRKLGNGIIPESEDEEMGTLADVDWFGEEEEE